MNKSILLAHFLALSVFMSCSKGESDPDSPVVKNEFAVTGLQDVALDSSVNFREYSFDVAQTSGTPEPVTLSVGGAPAGIDVSVDKRSGTPPFSGSIRFARKTFVSGGTYPISITATSASFTKSYTTSLEFSAVNGWTIDSIAYTVLRIVHTDDTFVVVKGYTEYQIETKYQNGDNIAGMGTKGPLPTADGVYTYDVVDLNRTTPQGTNEADVKCRFTDAYSSKGFLAKPLHNQKVTVTIKGGKYSISMPPTEMVTYDGSNIHRMLTIHASE